MPLDLCIRTKPRANSSRFQGSNFGYSDARHRTSVRQATPQTLAGISIGGVPGHCLACVLRLHRSPRAPARTRICRSSAGRVYLHLYRCRHLAYPHQLARLLDDRSRCNVARVNLACSAGVFACARMTTFVRSAGRGLCCGTVAGGQVDDRRCAYS